MKDIHQYVAATVFAKLESEQGAPAYREQHFKRARNVANAFVEMYAAEMENQAQVNAELDKIERLAEAREAGSRRSDEEILSGVKVFHLAETGRTSSDAPNVSNFTPYEEPTQTENIVKEPVDVAEVRTPDGDVRLVPEGSAVAWLDDEVRKAKGRKGRGR